jgi:DNA (cytosine-5)-methyltransferase 1
MRALDLCCKAGGAGVGLKRAGFDEVWGVDIEPQPRYRKPGLLFFRRDVLTLHVDAIRRFDFVWASPPCQKHTEMKTMHNAREHECIIEPLRELLIKAGVPYAIENVPGAPLRDPVRLCASSLCPACDGYYMQRHRMVETSWGMREAPPCNHRRDLAVLGMYGDHIRDRRRRPGSKARGVTDPALSIAQAITGIDWMTLNEMSESIPPAYSRFVAEDWMTSHA